MTELLMDPTIKSTKNLRRNLTENKYGYKIVQDIR